MTQLNCTSERGNVCLFPNKSGNRAPYTLQIHSVYVYALVSLYSKLQAILRMNRSPCVGASCHCEVVAICGWIVMPSLPPKVLAIKGNIWGVGTDVQQPFFVSVFQDNAPKKWTQETCTKKNVSTFTMGLCFSTQDWTNRTLLPKTCFLELYSRPDPYELLVKNPYWDCNLKKTCPSFQLIGAKQLSSFKQSKQSK